MKTFKSVEEKKCVCRRVIAMVVFSLLISAVTSIYSGPAKSFELNSLPLPKSSLYEAEVTNPMTTSAPAKEDPCLPLLQTVRQETPVSTSLGRNEDNARKAAALGLVFGLKYAVGPKEIAKSKRLNKPTKIEQHHDTNGVRALAVADYRRCKNENALKEISDWRWER